MCVSPTSGWSDDDVGVPSVPTMCTRCEEGMNKTHARRVVKGMCLGKGFGELKEERRGSVRAYWGVLLFLFVTRNEVKAWSEGRVS